MDLPKGVRDNLYFLLAETQSQLGNLEVLLDTASAAVAQRIVERQGYTYNLKMRVHDGCVDALRRGDRDAQNMAALRSAEAAASGLDRLGEICQHCVRLMAGLTRPRALRNQEITPLLGDVSRGVRLLEQAVDGDDTRALVKIGNIERKLDRAYHKQFRRHVQALEKKGRPHDVITSLFIVHRIEEMGDVLLAVSESIMSARMGQPMQIDRYRFLESALDGLGVDDAEVESIAQTRSGSGIAGIASADDDRDGYMAVFKDGAKGKLRDERDSVESWHEIFPGLAPQVLDYTKRGKHASLLIEHLPGLTFEQVVLQEDDAILAAAQKRLAKTVRTVWTQTRRDKPAPAGHVPQLRKRLGNVLEVHPAFDVESMQICGATVRSLDDLLARAERLERRLEPPFSVYIHGDFNLDNIIYDPENDQIRFIDLHRSRYLDYVQDVAVFLVSSYRLQVLDRPIRRRLTEVAVNFHASVARFARKNGDRTFEARLALGLARSFITSTRFVLDRTQARNLFLRGVYVLERIATLGRKQARDFRLPIEMIFR